MVCQAVRGLPDYVMRDWFARLCGGCLHVMMGSKIGWDSAGCAGSAFYVMKGFRVLCQRDARLCP